MPTVTPKLGEPVWGTQKRWEYTREAENKRIDWCAARWDAVAAGVAPASPADAGR